jgi:hypothetical protein
VFAHAEKAADADHDPLDFAGLVEKDLVDVAELLVLIVVDVKALELRSSPKLALAFRRAGGWGSRSSGLLVVRGGVGLSKRRDKRDAGEQSADQKAGTHCEVPSIC